MNKFIRCICISLAFICILLSTNNLISVNAEENALSSVSARSACLIEAESGTLLYGKNEGLRMPMASTTKIMTAIVAIEMGYPLDKIVSVPKEAVGIEGSSLYLAEGESISFEALLYGLLLCSANDAASAIAITLCGSEAVFVEKMNEKARMLGLTNTAFLNPHGLDCEGHYTTALELARLMAYCVKNDTFVSISSTQKKVFPRDDGTTRTMINHNRLLRENVGVIAGKTGFTKKSGRCLVTMSEKDSLSLICVTLNAPNDWSDHKALYEFGHSSYKRVNIPSIEIKIPVISGSKSTVSARTDEASLFLPNDDSEITKKLYAPRFLFASINKGDVLGRVEYQYNGKVVATLPLKAYEDVERVRYFNLFDFFREIILSIKDLIWKK